MMRFRCFCNKPELRSSTSSSVTLCLLRAVLVACLTLLNLPSKAIAIAQQPATGIATKNAQADVRPEDSAQEKKTTELVGKVVDEAGKPLTGASVFWANFLGSQTLTTSEADGRFQISVAEQDKAWTRFLWVYLPGYNVKAVQPLVGGGMTPDCVVSLEESQSIDIEVLEADGSPCSGAKLTPYFYEVPNGVFYSDISTGLTGIVPAGVAKLLSVTTNESGIATLKGLKKDFLGSVKVKSGELAEQDQRGNFNRDQFTIRLAPVANVRGKIDAADLSPLSDGKVRVNTKSPNPNANSDDPFSDADGPTTSVECTVAADGSFEAKNVGAGNVSVFFRWDANCPKQLRLPAPQKVLPGEELFVGLETAEAVKIKGILITDDTSEPIADCRVAVDFGYRNAGRERISHAFVSDANGEFEAYVLPGDISIQVVDATKSPAIMVEYDYPQSLRMTVAPNEELIELPPFKFVKQQLAEVLVVDTNGQPLANRLIRRLTKGPFAHTNARGVTDDKGVATVSFSRGREPADFSGEWIISENDQTDKIKDPRNLPRLKLKQSSPAILQLNK